METEPLPRIDLSAGKDRLACIHPAPDDAGPAPARTRVIVADDHEVVRNGVRAIFSSRREWAVVAEAGSPEQLLDILSDQPCDVLVTDYSMPSTSVPDGTRLISTLRRRYPGLKIILMTTISNVDLLCRMSALGVHGILDKACTPDEYLSAMDAVLDDRRYIAPSTRSRMMAMTMPGPQNLTVGQLEVLRMLATGRTVVEIASLTNRTRSSVSRQKRLAAERLGDVDDMSLLDHAARLGLAHPR